MFKTLINFASNIIKPGHPSKGSHPTSQAEHSPDIQSPSEYQPQLTNTISTVSGPEPASAPNADLTSARDANTSANPVLLSASTNRPEGSNVPDLDTLYRSMPLSQSMLCLAESIAFFNQQTFSHRTGQWLQEGAFQSLGASAITAKRQGDYGQAIAIFAALAQGCPYYYQIHHSMMKILGASGDLETALRALQLWCVATIPEKALRLDSRDAQPTATSAPLGAEQLPYLAGWAIADVKSMYHLGSLQMMVSEELSSEVKEAYILSLQGKQQKALHNPKIAIQRGKECAQDLPWDAIVPVMSTDMWQYLLMRSHQQAQDLKQRRHAA